MWAVGFPIFKPHRIMTVQWTSNQVAGMAPDAPSIKAGQKLADLAKWSLLGRSETALWGEAKGSGKKPYQVRIDLSGPAFKCSCPSRKFPCKHALGLAFIYADNPGTLSEDKPPEWVAEWIASRTARTNKQAERAAKTSQPVDRATADRRAKAQQQRAAARLDRIKAGVEELDQRLKDLVRQGLAGQLGESYGAWDEIAARMVDAQAPGLARLVRALAGVRHSGEGWQGRLLEQVARLHLLLAAYQRFDTLPPERQADISSRIGLTLNKDEVAQQAGIQDTWWVLGKQIEQEDKLRVQRAWLWGVSSARPTLVLDFAAGNQPLDTGLEPGHCLGAELAFYPGSRPLRALVKNQRGLTGRPLTEATGGFTSIADAVAGYACALTADPWTELHPMGLAAVIPVVNEGRWQVRDAEGHALPLPADFTEGWRLLAFSGGQPLPLFGEWNGAFFRPLTVFLGESVWVLGGRGTLANAV